MFWQFFVNLTVLQLASIHAKQEPNRIACTTSEQKIRNEILDKMSTHTGSLWNITQSKQNIIFFPAIDIISVNMILIQIYYDSGLASFHFKNEFLETPFALASLLDKLQQSTNVQLKFKNAEFHDQNTSKEYLNDIKQYYHSEVYEMAFDSKNSESLKSSMNKWMSENTKGRKPKTENLLMPGIQHNFHTHAVHFVGCWDRSKTLDDSLVINIGHRRRRRFIKLPTLSFENIPQLEVESFNSKDRIGYYNDTKLQFEAIRLPFMNGEFATTFVLPYINKSLDLFANFTSKQYREILERVNETYENIDFAIPIMELPMISVRQNGTSINTHGPIDCTFSKSFDSNHTDYKPFKVDRPFGMFIYHEITKFVLFQAWIADPTNVGYVSRRFLKHTNARGEELDSKHIY